MSNDRHWKPAPRRIQKILASEPIDLSTFDFSSPTAIDDLFALYPGAVMTFDHDSVLQHPEFADFAKKQLDNGTAHYVDSEGKAWVRSQRPSLDRACKKSKK
jgi:hypothetical protein